MIVRTCLLIIVLFFSSDFQGLRCQSLEGSWICSHAMSIKTVTVRSVFSIDNLFSSETLYNKLEKPEVDSSYYAGGEILLISENDQVAFYNLNGVESEGIINRTNGTVVFTDGKLDLRVDADSQFVLIENVNDSMRWEHTFHPLKSSNIFDTDGISQDFTFSNSSWFVQADSTSINYQLSLNVVDSTTSILTRRMNDEILTSFARSLEGWYFDHLFFSFLDEFNSSVQMFHFYGMKNDSLLGDTYEKHVFEDEPPRYNKIFFVKKDTLSQLEKKNFKSQIYGKWQAVNEPLWYDTMFFYGFLANQEFEISFGRDQEFRFDKSAILLRNGHSIPLVDSLKGTWDIGPTGEYISIYQTESHYPFLSIREIQEDSMILFYNLKAMSDESDYNSYENRKIVLKRIDDR